jgi:co-chaperonin GroES (HSP10)
MNATALGNWILCRAVRPSNAAGGGLIMPKDFDKEVVTEGVAEVISVGQGKWLPESGTFLDHGLRPGDKILYRGFLRYAHQLGEIFGEEKSTDIFALSADDVMATLEGSGTIGYYDEYRI